MEGTHAHEGVIHSELDAYRLRGEWFSDCAEVREAIGSYIKNGISVPPPKKAENREPLIEHCIASVNALVRREMANGHLKMVAYRRVGELVGISGEWLREFIRNGGDPPMAVGWAILEHSKDMMPPGSRTAAFKQHENAVDEHLAALESAGLLVATTKETDRSTT